jgi:flavorubredoxin
MHLHPHVYYVLEGGVAMSVSVLVAHATRYGSTQEVAEAVAATLREQASPSR